MTKRLKPAWVAQLSEQCAAWGYLAGWKAIGRLPEPAARALGDLIAKKASKNGQGPEQLRLNLSRVVGCAPADVPDALVLASMRSYMRYWMECFRLPHIVSPRLADEVARGGTGLEHITEGAASGDGVVLVLPHCGNWDMAGMWLVSEVGSFATVAERLKPESLYDAFVEFRESLGFRVLPLTGGRPPTAELRRTLDDGGTICLLGDRDLKDSGVPVMFFGEETTMPIGAAKLAADTGARLHPVGLSFTDSGWHMRVHDRVPVDNRAISDVVQDIARAFEEDIAAHPADWHMLQPMWTADVARRKAMRRK